MSSHKHHEKLMQIKDAVIKSKTLSEEEKSNTIKHLESWILEDKAEGIITDELLNIASGVRPILKELGLL